MVVVVVVVVVVATSVAVVVAVTVVAALAAALRQRYFERGTLQTSNRGCVCPCKEQESLAEFCCAESQLRSKCGAALD